MKKILLLITMMMVASNSFASGPDDRITWKEAYGVTYKLDEITGCSRAQEKAREAAEHVSEDERNFYDKDGYYVDSRECEGVTRKGDCECKKRGDKLRCYYEAEFHCIEWVYHKDQ